jgi:hypothetical protein
MSLKSKVLAGAASLTLVGGVGVAGAFTAGTASAATPSCGGSCINIYSPDFGNATAPNDVIDIYKQGENLGQPIILFRTSNVDPAEDLYPTYQGDVASLFEAGLVTAAVALHYGCLAGTSAFETCAFGNPNVSIPKSAPLGSTDLWAFEYEYAPFGVESGWCIGTATAATNGTKVSLQPCGVSSKTYWIADYFQGQYSVGSGYAVPLINASTTNFSQPAVLTYPGSSSPTDEPRPQLYTSALTGETNGTPWNGVGTIDDNQLWWGAWGPLNN